MTALRALGPWTLSACAALALGALVMLWQLPGLIRAVSAPRPTLGIEQQRDQARLDAYKASYETSLAQIAGRTMFYVPPAPPPPAVVEEEDKASEPAAPARYSGPSIIAMINDAVWFDSGERMTLVDAARNGIRVVTINAPWGATLEWNGKEFDVPLFDRTTPRFLEQPEESPPPAEPADAEPESLEPTDHSEPPPQEPQP